MLKCGTGDMYELWIMELYKFPRVLEWAAISFSRETIKRVWLINFGNWWNQACHKNKEIKFFFLVASY